MTQNVQNRNISFLYTPTHILAWNNYFLVDNNIFKLVEASAFSYCLLNTILMHILCHIAHFSAKQHEAEKNYPYTIPINRWVEISRHQIIALLNQKRVKYLCNSAFRFKPVGVLWRRCFMCFSKARTCLSNNSSCLNCLVVKDKTVTPELNKSLRRIESVSYTHLTLPTT